MNAPHLHLLVNHLPLFATLFAVALVAAGLYWKEQPVTKAGLIFAVVAGVGAFVAAQTGERAAEVVEHLPAVSETTIEAHEEAGKAAMWASVIFGASALVALAVPERMPGIKMVATVGSLAMALVAFALIARAAYLGGFIRHTEISGGTLSVLIPENAGAHVRDRAPTPGSPTPKGRPSLDSTP